MRDFSELESKYLHNIFVRQIFSFFIVQNKRFSLILKKLVCLITLQSFYDMEYEV